LALNSKFFEEFFAYKIAEELELELVDFISFQLVQNSISPTISSFVLGL
jgi:hypothetical protein